MTVLGDAKAHDNLLEVLDGLSVKVVSFPGVRRVVVHYESSFASATTVEMGGTGDEIGDAINRALERLADKVPGLFEGGEL